MVTLPNINIQPAARLAAASLMRNTPQPVARVGPTSRT